MSKPTVEVGYRAIRDSWRPLALGLHAFFEWGDGTPNTNLLPQLGSGITPEGRAHLNKVYADAVEAKEALGEIVWSHGVPLEWPEEVRREVHRAHSDLLVHLTVVYAAYNNGGPTPPYDESVLLLRAWERARAWHAKALEKLGEPEAEAATPADPTTPLPAGRYAVEQPIPELALQVGDAVDLTDGLATRWLSDEEQARLREHLGALRRLEDVEGEEMRRKR